MSVLKHELRVAGQLSDLPSVMDFVTEMCHQAGVTPSAEFDLQLAAEEACCNVIQHAYGEAGGEFTISFEVRGPDVAITVRDRGQKFDPAAVPEPDMTVPLEDRPIGGLGLYLMRQLMDDVRFDFSAATGNTLVMVKRNVAPIGPDREPAEQDDA
jgi:serine/threonine-protein kinase RsbW